MSQLFEYVNKPSKNKVRSYVQKDIGTTRSAMEAQISRTYTAFAEMQQDQLKQEQLIESTSYKKIQKDNTFDNHSQSTRIEAPSQSAAKLVGKPLTRHHGIDVAVPDSPIMIHSPRSDYRQQMESRDESFAQGISERRARHGAESSVQGYMSKPITPMVHPQTLFRGPMHLSIVKTAQNKRIGSAHRIIFESQTPGGGNESEFMNALGSMNNTRSRIPKVDCPQVISRVSGSNFSRTPTRNEQERYPVLAVHKASVSELSTFARGQTPRMRRRGAPRDNSLRQPLSFVNSTFKKK